MSNQTEYEEVRLVAFTDGAGLFDIDGEEFWIPWSQVECFMKEREDVGRLYVNNWWVLKEELP